MYDSIDFYLLNFQVLLMTGLVLTSAWRPRISFRPKQRFALLSRGELLAQTGMQRSVDFVLRFIFRHRLYTLI